MTQVIAYKVYTTGTSLAYCGVAGSAADAYVPSGTAICSDPFLQDQIATADGTDWQYVGETRSWTQPTMTGNQMTLGGSVWGIYESGGQTGNLWKISDKSGSSYWDAGRPGLPINVIFYNPNPILATSVYFYNYSSDGINNYNFSGSNDNSTWTQLSSGTGKGHNQQWTDTITTSTPYKYFRLQVTQTLDSSGWLNLREVTISGTENVVADPVVSDLGSDAVRMFAAIPVTSYPYAHYEGTIYDIADAPSGAFEITAEEKAEIEDAISDGGTLAWYSDQRPYVHKESVFTTPIMTANGTMGGNDFATTQSDYYGSNVNNQAWRCFNGVKTGGDEGWVSARNGTNKYVIWYNPEPLYISAITITNSNNDFIYSFTLNVSNDGTNYTTLTTFSNTNRTAYGDFTTTISTANAYKYWKLITSGGSTGDYAKINEIALTATIDPITYEVPQRHMIQLIPAISESGTITNYYTPAVAPAHPYAHYNGVIYPIANAPAGAYPLTDLQYYTLNYYVNAGGTLRWYSNQRPYVDGDMAWTQPVLTSDSTSTALGTITTSASSIGGSGNAYPYHALDGIKSGTGSGSSTGYWCCQSTSSQTGQWWQVLFPYQLKITGITFYNRYASNNYYVVNGQFWTSNAKTTAIGDRFQTANSAWASYVVTGIPASGVLTDTLYFYINSGSDYCGIGELEITATRYAILYEVPLTNFVS